MLKNKYKKTFVFGLVDRETKPPSISGPSKGKSLLMQCVK